MKTTRWFATYRIIPWMILLAVCFASTSMVLADTPQPPPGLVKPWPPAGPSLELNQEASNGGKIDDFFPYVCSSDNHMERWTYIVYQMTRDSNNDIFINRCDGSEQIQLTNTPDYDGYARLNRGATRIVFETNRDGNFEIYAMNTDGSGLLRLTDMPGDDYGASWSFDGSQIVFISERDGNPEIYTMNSDGTNQRRLTYDGHTDYAPTFSPDGTQIAWARVSDEISGQIWIMNADGGDPHTIASPFRFLAMGNLAWSPDGNYIAFDSDLSGDYFNDVNIIHPDGSGKQIIAHDFLVDYVIGNWAPDNQHIIVTGAGYRIQDNYLILTSLSLNICDTGYCDAITTNGVYKYPDWQTADLIAPTSQIAALPAYSRAVALPLAIPGGDAGPSGINNYNVQLKQNIDDPWTDYLVDSSNSSTIFRDGVPGITLFFRVQASDFAGNEENWPASPQGDTHTTLYSWKLNGKITDLRGNPAAGIQVTTDPDTPINASISDIQGDYTAYLKAGGQQTISLDDSAGASSTLNLDIQNDLNVHFILPSKDNLIQNGGFEADTPLAHWEKAGTLEVIPSQDLPQIGNQAIRIGDSCSSDPCFSPKEELDWDSTNATLYQVNIFGIIPDTDGSTHVFYKYYDSPRGDDVVQVRTRSVEGNWSDPETIVESPAMSDVDMTSPVIDPAGTLHYLYLTEGQWFYVNKIHGEPWSEPLTLPGMWSPSYLVDATGALNIIAKSTSENPLLYLKRNLGGTWVSPITIPVPQEKLPLDKLSIVNSFNGAVQVFWQNYQEIENIIRVSNTQWIFLDPLKLPKSIGQLVVTNDARGQINVLSATGYGTYWVKQNKDLTWTDKKYFSESLLNFARAFLDPHGILHLVINNIAGSSVPNLYFTKSPDGDWSQPTYLRASEKNFYFSADNRIQSVFYVDNDKFYYQTTAASGNDAKGAISQTITIPQTAHRPTLSFYYSLDRAEIDGSTSFKVLLTADNNTTEVFSTLESTPWKQAWIDLEPWKGKTVRVTFQLQQAAADPNAMLYLDNITAGSWLTPVISNLSAAQLTPGTTLTIQGENFIQTPTVYFGTTQLSGVKWIDENTLQVTIKGKIPAGIDTLWVVNPEGQRAVSPIKVQSGSALFLPALLK